jgi:hypothetical protein
MAQSTKSNSLLIVELVSECQITELFYLLAPPKNVSNDFFPPIDKIWDLQFERLAYADGSYISNLPRTSKDP